MKYEEIGRRVRKIRKARKMSQETLAERVGISVTHMSHIETANTKLSLPVFIAIAEALDVQTDALLYDESPERLTDLSRDAAALIETCTVSQARAVLEIARTAKSAMDAYLE